MSRRDNRVIPFVLISLSLHALLFVSWPRHKTVARTPGQIAVSFLPAPDVPRPPPPPEPKPERAPVSKSRPAVAAKKAVEPRIPPSLPVEKTEKPDPVPERKVTGPADPAPERSVTKPAEVLQDAEPVEESRADIPITRRRLPRLNELLPPATWSPSQDEGLSREGPIRLETREPKYLPYFEHIKRAIEVVWEYPESALRYGAEGKLWLEFTILSNGALEGPRLLRSSGFSELDEEALRAVRTAAPFRPIPNHIGRRRLDIVATFEYHNNRLRYDFLR